MRKHLILCFVCINLFSSCGKNDFSINDVPLDAILNKYVQEGYYPFLYARLEDRRGNIIYEHSSVNKEILPDDIIDGQTMIRIWSMSKIVTIALVMDLIEDSVLNLEDPVTKYIPEFSNLKVATDENGVSLLSLIHI